MQKGGMNISSNDVILIIILGFFFLSIWSSLNLQILRGSPIWSILINCIIIIFKEP